jgi:hypothetical protein
MTTAISDALTTRGLDKAGVEDVIKTILAGAGAASLADDMTQDQRRGAILHAIRDACERRWLEMPGYYRPTTKPLSRRGTNYGSVKVRI